MKIPCLLFLLSALTLAPNDAPAQIRIRLSVKFILDEAGNMPGDSSGNGNLNSFQDAMEQIEAANSFLASTCRGYQLDLVDLDAVAGISDYFDLARTDKAELEEAAKDDPAAFKWKDRAINIYVNNAANSGSCAIPGTGDDLIIIGQNGNQDTIFHEVGHFLWLYHTHQGENKDDCDPGNKDKIQDTLPDSTCWKADEGTNSIAQNSYGFDYDELSSSRRELVDNTYFNVMSYRTKVRDRLTPDQLDRWTDAANGAREHVASGRTWFVDEDALGRFPDGSSDSTLKVGGPYKKVENGINAASLGDIVLIRSGTYLEPMTITNAVTLRATRGNVLIR